MEKHVLVIDDDNDLAELIRISLETKGYRVNIANNAKQAERLLNLQSADLVITDIFMDGGDGYEFIFKWRRQGMACKLIAMSGGGAAQGADMFLETARLAGVQRTFMKPFSCKDLLHAVDELLTGE